MISESEYNDILFDDVQNMTDGFGQVCCDCKTKVKDGYAPRYEITAGKCPIEAGGDCPLRSKGRYIDLDLAKKVIAKFKGYLDEDMIERIQIALEKECEATNGSSNYDT